MARTHTLSVSVAAVSITPLGRVEVRATESSARTATVAFLPAAGSYAPEDWIGAAVTIDYVSDPDGTPVNTRIYTGYVDWPVLDETTGVLTLQCSDLLQEYFEALADDAAILAVLTGAKLSDAVFGEREDGWQRADDALSTIRAEVHYSRTGALTLTDWSAKVTPDYSYTSSDYLHASPRVTFAQRRELINTITITFDYRFDRFKIREHTFGWRAGPSGGSTGWSGFCEWFASSHDLPSTDMIETAAMGTSWPIHGAITYTHLPRRGVYYCNGGPVGWIGVAVDDANGNDFAAQEAARKKIAFSAAWAGRKRWAQTITETYTLTVACAGSVALWGNIPGEDSAGLETAADDAGWEASEETEIPAGFAVDAIGDYVDDQDDRTASANAIECLLQVADHRIAASHRRNYVEWECPLEPAIDLEHTAQITAGRITAKGKVAEIGHVFDVDSGRATTTIRIACARGGGGSSDSLTAPSAPDTSPTYQAPDSSTALINYIGGNDNVDDWVDGDHDGESYVSGNQSIITTTDSNKQYPQRVHVIGPDIEEEAHANVEASATGAYAVAVPDDTLAVTIS